MTKKKPAKDKAAKFDPDKRLAQCESVLEEVDRFTKLIAQHEADIAESLKEVLEAKAVYDEKKAKHQKEQEALSSTTYSLVQFLRPGVAEILPLFDRMEPADEDKHGAHSDVWRKEPVTAIGLSLLATKALMSAEVLLVGQLQDRIQANPEAWYEAIDGLSRAVALAVADQLNTFINDRCSR